MTRTAWLVAAGVSAFLLFLVSDFPAAVALRWFAPDALRTSGVSGTLWRGSAAGADVGALHLTDLNWTLSPLTLLTGGLGADVDTRIGDGRARGAIALRRGGGLRCTVCSYEGPVAGLRTLAPALRTLDGRLDLKVDAIEVRNNWPTRAVGTASLTDVPIGLPGQARGSGLVTTIAATASADPVPDNGRIELTVQDGGGPLELSGRLTITPPGNYEFAGRARARPGAPAELVNTLAALGGKGSDGSTEIGFSGSL